MEISFQRFAQLTALIAAGSVLAVSCTVENADDDKKTDSSEGGSDQGAGGAITNQAGATNTGAGRSGVGGATVQGGSVSDAGSSGAVNVAGSTAVAGAAGSLAANAGAGGTSASGGSAGQVGSAGSVGIAGNAGRSGVAGSVGVAGGASVAGSAGIAGQMATAGTAGQTGVAGAASCVTSDPAEEGMGFDCTDLPYYAEECPDPSGEGTASAQGVYACWFYSDGRTESVKVLTDCLSALTEPASGWCGAEHEAQVEACRAKMAKMTCASSAVQATCATYNAQCPAVTVSACQADLSTLSDDEIATTVDPCVEGLEAIPATCGTKFKLCTTHANHAASVDTACASLKANCSGIDLTACKDAIDPLGTGVATESYYQVWLPECMAWEEADGATCTDAFVACTS